MPRLLLCAAAMLVLVLTWPALGQEGNTMVSTGTGFVVDPRGYILTNEHVVHLAKRVRVRFQDETMVPAQVISVDAQRDLALLKVATNQALPALPIGKSAEVQRQEQVLTLGFPFGEGAVTSTSGRIVSIRTEGAEQVFVSDAVINPGNSGGPMLNDRGEVIGVIKSILIATIGGERMKAGEAFAIPISFALPMLAAVPDFDWSAVGQGGRGPAPLTEVDARASPSVVQILSDRAPEPAGGAETDEARAFRENATALIKSYLDRLELKYEALEDRNPPMFIVPFRMDNTSLTLGILIDHEHLLVHMFLNRYLEVPQNHPRLAEIMRHFMTLNWRLNVGKFEWDESDGEVRYSFVFTTENGVGYEAFVAILRTLLDTGDKLWPALDKLVRGEDQ